MAKLKTSINFTSTCILSVKDETGFYSGANPDGFIAEGGALLTDNDYHISDGYFINAILYHQFIGKPTISNNEEVYQYINTMQVKPIYSENFVQQNYTLERDGVYSYKRLFVISKAFYDANKSTNRFDLKQVIYYDETTDKFYEVVVGVPTLISFTDAVLKFGALHAGSTVTYKFVSTCYLSKCHYLLQKQLIESTMSKPCTISGAVVKRDFISMTLNVIKYLKESGHLTQIQKIIESVDTCNMICKEVGVNTNSDCGCNG